MSADTTLKSIRYPNPEILHFEVKKNMHLIPPVAKTETSFKGWTPFSHRGGKVCILGLTQMAVSWVWGVWGGQIFFVMNFGPIGTHLGCGPRRKVFAPIRHPPEVSGPKNGQKSAFWVRGNDPPDGPKSFSVRIRSRNVLSGPSLIKWGYKHFHSPSRTDSMSPWKLRPRALLVNCPSISLKDSGQNFQKFRWSKITSKDT